MQRYWMIGTVFALAAAFAAAASRVSPEPSPESSRGSNPEGHPEGHPECTDAGEQAGGGLKAGPDEVCATGCAAASYETRKLSAAELDELALAWAADPKSPQGERALDTLLFHTASPEAAEANWVPNEVLLGHEGASFLMTEIGRGHALLELRLVDREGRVRLELPPTRMPLGQKQHVVAHETATLQPPEVSGTIKRVGLEHLWVRL